MASPTPRGIHQIAASEKYALVKDLNLLGATADAAIDAMEAGAEAYTDVMGADVRAHADDLHAQLVAAGANLADPTKFTENTQLTKYGEPYANTAYTLSGHIPVTAGTTYSISAAHGWAWYGSGGFILFGSAGTTPHPDVTVTAPAGATTLRVDWLNANATYAVVAAGSTLPPYEPFGESSFGPALGPLVRATADQAADEAVGDLFTTTKNMADPAKATAKTGLSSSGAPYATDYYSTSGHIPVEAGATYSVSEARRVGWYGPSGAFVSQVDNPNNGPLTGATAPTGASTMRVMWLTGNTDQIMVVAGATVPEEFIEFGTVFNRSNVIIPGYLPESALWSPLRNLHNPGDPGNAPGMLVNTTGTTPFAGYNATHHIDVTPGLPYSVTANRNIYWFNEAGGYVSRVDNSAMTPTEGTVAPPGAATMRASVPDSAWGAVMVMQAPTLPESFIAHGQRTLNPDVAAALSGGGGSGPLTVSRAGDTVTLTSTVGGAELEQKFSLAESGRNGAFNFGTVTYDGIVMATATDDITPIRIGSGSEVATVGGGHGWPSMQKYTNPDGKDSSDLGSVWTDGTRQYILLEATTGGVILGGDYTRDPDGHARMARVAPTAPLAHVSGATHTGTIDHTTGVNAQAYPSTTRVHTHLYADDTEMLDGSTRAHRVRVIESYEVMDYGDMYDQMAANPGRAARSLPIAGAVLHHTTYTWTSSEGGAACTVDTHLTELTPTPLAGCGFVQAGAISGGDRRWRQIIGVGAVGGVDWTVGVDTAQWSTDAIATSAALTGAHAPVVDLERAQDGGATVGAFAIGYRPYVGGVTDSATRLASSPDRLWDIRGTDKHYPNAITAMSSGWGHVEAHGFRAYLSPSTADTIAAKTTAPTAWSALAAATGMGGTA